MRQEAFRGPMPEISIEVVPVSELVSLSRDVEADPMRYAVAPIEPKRALAHSLNPVASPGDPGLVIAYAEGRCIGYIGLLPIIASVGGREHKILAPSTQYVHPDFRRKPPPGGMTIAERMYDMIRQLGFDQLNTGFNEAGARIHQRRPEWFTPLPPYTYLRIKLSPFQPVSSILRRVALKTGMSFLEGIYHASQSHIDQPLEPMVRKILKVQDCRFNNALSIVPVEKVLEPKDELPALNGLHFKRDVNVINWMIKHPWLEVAKRSHRRYFFSSPRERHEYHCYHILDRGGMRTGFIVTLISSVKLFTTLRILDHRMTSPDMKAFLLNFVIEKALNHRVNAIECAGAFRPVIENNRLLRTITTAHKRAYFISLSPASPLKGREPEIVLDYCDGDRPYV